MLLLPSYSASFRLGVHLVSQTDSTDTATEVDRGKSRLKNGKEHQGLPERKFLHVCTIIFLKIYIYITMYNIYDIYIHIYIYIHIVNS